jgi:hypothetical protein
MNDVVLTDVSGCDLELYGCWMTGDETNGYLVRVTIAAQKFSPCKVEALLAECGIERKVRSEFATLTGSMRPFAEKRSVTAGLTRFVLGCAIFSPDGEAGQTLSQQSAFELVSELETLVWGQIVRWAEVQAEIVVPLPQPKKSRWGWRTRKIA